MSRRDIYIEERKKFDDFNKEHLQSPSMRNILLETFDFEYMVTELCDLTDAICDISKSMEGIKAEISQIRRQMPR